MGPGAPAGPYHHYAFELYALDIKLDIPSAAPQQAVQTRTAIFEGSPKGERDHDPDRTGVAVVVELTRVRGFANGQRFEMLADATPG